MTILHAQFTATAVLAWQLTDEPAKPGVGPFKTGEIEAGKHDPLVELRHLELRSGVARVEFSATPEHPITQSERDYAYACGWQLV